VDDRKITPQGFTLIELLLAIGLSALLVGVVMGTYLAIRKGVAESLTYHEVEVEGKLIIDRLRRDLEAAYIGNPLYPERFFFTSKVEGVPWNTTRLSFASAEAGDGKEGLKGIGDLGRITYRLKSSEKEGRYLLYRDLAPLQSQYVSEKELISDRVVSFRLAFEGENHLTTRRWDSRAQRWRDRLPLLARVELVLKDAKGTLHTFRGDVHPRQDWMR